MNNENNTFNNNTQGFNPNDAQFNNNSGPAPMNDPTPMGGQVNDFGQTPMNDPMPMGGQVNDFGQAPMNDPMPMGGQVNDFGQTPMNDPTPMGGQVNNFGQTPMNDPMPMGGQVNNYQQPQYNNEPPKKKNNILLIIIIVIVVLAIGVGAAIYFVGKTVKKTVNVYENEINEKINSRDTQTTTTTDVGTTDTSDTITHKGYIFYKEPGFTYSEKNGVLLLTGTSEIYTLTVTNITFDSIPVNQLEERLKSSGYSISDFKKTTYNGYGVITANVLYQGINMVYALTASSDGLNTMQIMGTTKSGYPSSGMLEKGIKMLKAAKYTGNSSSFASDTEINPDFSVLLNIEE